MSENDSDMVSKNLVYRGDVIGDFVIDLFAVGLRDNEIIVQVRDCFGRDFSVRELNDFCVNREDEIRLRESEILEEVRKNTQTITNKLTSFSEMTRGLIEKCVEENRLRDATKMMMPYLKTIELGIKELSRLSGAAGAAKTTNNLSLYKTIVVLDEKGYIRDKKRLRKLLGLEEENEEQEVVEVCQ